VAAAHLCRRWLRRGMPCPFAPHPAEEFADGEPRRPSGPERRSRAQQAFQPTLEFKGDPVFMPRTPKELLLPSGALDKEGLADVMGRVLDQGKPAAVAGMAEEAVAEAVRDRVFNLPDLPQLPPVPAVGRGVSSRGFAGTGFFFDATQRLFGLMRSFPREGDTGPTGGGGEPGGGTGQGGGARG